MEAGSGRSAVELKNYYRLGRRLLACLLLPLAAGVFFTQQWVMAAALLYLAWLGSSCICTRAMGDLAVHSAASLAKKSADWRSLLWGKIRHDLMGCACIIALLMLFAIALPPEHGIEFLQAELDAGDDGERTVAVLTCFWATAIIPFMNTLLVDQRSKRTRWWVITIAIYLFSQPTWYLAFLLPHLLSIPLYLLGLASRNPRRRAALIINASNACHCALTVMVFVTALNLIGLFLEQINSDWQLPFGFDPFLFAIVFSAFALHSFMQHERIRNGLFSADPEGISQIKLGRMNKKRMLRALNPAARPDWHWWWVRLITKVGEHAWLVALVSICASFAIGFN